MASRICYGVTRKQGKSAACLFVVLAACGSSVLSSVELREDSCPIRRYVTGRRKHASTQAEEGDRRAPSSDSWVGRGGGYVTRVVVRKEGDEKKE